jgi:hypothetical protein
MELDFSRLARFGWPPAGRPRPMLSVSANRSMVTSWWTDWCEKLVVERRFAGEFAPASLRAWVAQSVEQRTRNA